MTDDTDLPHGEGDGPAYEVGYGKPPKHGQFQKGNTKGKGRPRGSRNLKAIVEEVSREKVSAQINGKTVKISRKELSVRQMAQKAGAGDLKAIDRFLSLSERFDPPAEEGPIPEEETAYELETLLHYARMHGMLDDE